MTKEDSWKLIESCPDYYYDPEESDYKTINMGDTLGWAVASCIIVTDANVERIAYLYHFYGFCGLVYFHIVEDTKYNKSEFTDNNRFIQFVINEEKIKKDIPDSNKRAYTKRSYTINGEIK